MEKLFILLGFLLGVAQGKYIAGMDWWPSNTWHEDCRGSPLREKNGYWTLPKSSPKMTPLTELVTDSNSEPPITDVRLPQSLYPVYYDIELKPNIYDEASENFTFDGHVGIQIRCDVSTNNITLHTNMLTIDNSSLSLKVKAGAGSAPSIVSWEVDKDRQFMIIYLDGMLVKDALYYLQMSFSGPLRKDLTGFYLSSYERDNKTIYAATTQFEATDARKAFPCFDEPAIKSIFNVTLVRKQYLVSLSNMPIARTENRRNGWVADVYQTTPIMPTYLVACIVFDFSYKEDVTAHNIRYRAWSRSEWVDLTEYALGVGVDVLTYYEDYFGVAFPLPKQDMVAIPDFDAGAMENWGLIIFREATMLYEPGVSSEADKQMVATVIAHELAHQWFGNLVTLSWWGDLWLNEGFASYVEYIGTHSVHPDWKIFEQFVIWEIQTVFDYDGLVTSHPVYVPVFNPDEISEIFDPISYKKGASIIRMMRFFLGESSFRQGLENYLRELAYSNAFHDDLWQALTEQAARDGKNIDVKEVMDTWTLQMNYPVVMVRRVGDSRILVTQQRYLMDYNSTDPETYTSPFGYRWDIPFAYTTSLENNFDKTDVDVIWMSRNKSRQAIASSIIPPLSDSTGWVLANPMQYGFYRVNYDLQNWRALIRQLKTDHKKISAINRAQIINDAWNLAKSGLLTQKIALQTVEYIHEEMDLVPVWSAYKELGYVDSMLARTDLNSSFQAFMRSKVQGPFNIVGTSNTGASHNEVLLRTEIVTFACKFGIQECVDQAKELVARWMQDPENNPIDPDLKDSVFCTAVKYGGRPEWDFIFSEYKTSTVATDSHLLLGALSCSQDESILGSYLDLALTPTEIPISDAMNVIVYVARNHVGRDLAWDFFVSNWQVIKTDYYINLNSLIRLIGALSESFNTQAELEKLENFIYSTMDLIPYQSEFDPALEKTKANIKWLDDNLEMIESWLGHQGFCEGNSCSFFIC